jgi:hypothetical protein
VCGFIGSSFQHAEKTVKAFLPNNLWDIVFECKANFLFPEMKGDSTGKVDAARG